MLRFTYKSIWLAIWGLALLGTIWSQQGTIESSPLDVAERQSVSSLISDLGNGDFRRRERAFKALLPFGSRIEKELRFALNHRDLEVRLRVQSLLRSLPATISREKVRLEPTLLSLRAEGLTIDHVIRVLERDSLLVFQRPLAIPSNLSITLDLDRKPLFEILDLLSANIGHKWYRDYGSGQIRFGRVPDARVPLVRYQGPLRIALSSISRNASRHFGNGKSESCYLQGQVDVEPGAPVLGAWLPPQIETATDDRGRSLIAEKVIRSNFNPIAKRPSFHFTCTFKPPARDATKIEILKGSFEVAVAAGYRQLTLHLGQEAGAKEIQIEGLRIRLIANVLQKGERTLTFEIESQPVFADKNGKYPVQDQIIEFLDISGDVVEVLSPLRRNRRGGLDIIVAQLPRFAIHDIRIRSLAQIRRRKIAFEFKGVPLP